MLDLGFVLQLEYSYIIYKVTYIVYFSSSFLPSSLPPLTPPPP